MSNYIALVFAEDLKRPDKTLAKLDSKTFFSDQTQVQWDDMARVRKGNIRITVPEAKVIVNSVIE